MQRNQQPAILGLLAAPSHSLAAAVIQRPILQVHWLSQWCGPSYRWPRPRSPDGGR